MAALNRIIWGAVRGPAVPYPEAPGAGAGRVSAGDRDDG
jgi:hypothetical protein